MPSTPDTRESLILRLPTASDAQAWREFVSIYEPLLFRFARRRGLQEADAREIAQNVFLAVANAVPRWTPDPSRGPFRAWLFRIARNQLIHYVTKHHRLRATGQSAEWDALQRVPNLSNGEEEVVQDYRREMFRLAAAQMRDSFHETTWKAFWGTAVLGRSADEVALELGLTSGAVYIAKCRVTAKLKSLIAQWEACDAL
ncbi:sigma-70 family RNA polymerase sigma factor [Pirellulaceae bacterium SH467]|jgi:RNA polymerase sigma-70 factor (ECF subfamily)